MSVDERKTPWFLAKSIWPTRTSGGDRLSGASTVLPTVETLMNSITCCSGRGRTRTSWCAVSRSYRDGPYYILKSPQSGAYLRLGASTSFST